jgi:DNA-binding NtrC family response regulator
MSRDDSDARTAPKARKLLEYAPCFGLRVVAGNDAGKTMRIDTGRKYLVGQSATCEMVLRDREVSRRHASVEIEGERLRFIDLGSTNGSWLGSVGLGDGRLSGGEHVTLGGSTLVVERLPTAAIEPLGETEHFGLVLGRSVAMRRLYPLFARLAASHVPLVIEGETGAGKEVLAYSLHAEAPRRDGPFIVLDCAGGAADEIDIATFERARGGTLLLDEIAELALTLQPKLLRLVGTPDVRVVSTTSRDLDREVQEGRFRDDLFFRLAVARIELPPLRERGADVEFLARAFWASLGPSAGPFPAEFLTRYRGHTWPGNVRELLNTVVRWQALGEMGLGEQIAEDAPESLAAPPAATAAGRSAGDDLVERLIREAVPFSKARQLAALDFERRYVKSILESFGGNVTKAAQASGIGRRYFHMLLAKIEDSEGP